MNQCMSYSYSWFLKISKTLKHKGCRNANIDRRFFFFFFCRSMILNCIGMLLYWRKAFGFHDNNIFLYYLSSISSQFFDIETIIYSDQSHVFNSLKYIKKIKTFLLVLQINFKQLISLYIKQGNIDNIFAWSRTYSRTVNLNFVKIRYKILKISL